MNEWINGNIQIYAKKPRGLGGNAKTAIIPEYNANVLPELKIFLLKFNKWPV